MLVAIIVLLVVAALLVLFSRVARADGGPRRIPPPRADDSWNPDLPAKPYAERIQP